MWHDLDLEDLEALRRLDCQIAGALGWRDAGLRFDGERDVIGDYVGVAPGEFMSRKVPHFSTDKAAAASLPVARRAGKKVWFLMASPVAVALIFLAQMSESYER